MGCVGEMVDFFVWKEVWMFMKGIVVLFYIKREFCVKIWFVV